LCDFPKLFEATFSTINEVAHQYPPVQDMGLKVGDRVAALVKATNVSVRRQIF